MAKLHELNEQNFFQEVLDQDTTVLVDFGGEWCVPCKKITLILREIAVEFDGELRIGEVDVDKCPQLAMKYKVRSVPSLLIFKQGRVVDQVIGAVTKQSLVKKLQTAINR